MRFRFTLRHRASNTAIVINEPDGWKQAVLKIARDKEFYSLIEFFDGTFIYYGDNGVINGGIHFIKALEQQYGPDVEIEQLIELAPDDETYETVFEGQLDLSLAEELPKNKIRIPVIRDNFWAKFNSRWQTPVDLQAFTDLDGEPIDPVETVDLNLPSQKIRYNGEYNWLESVTYPAEDFFHGLQLDWEETIIDDIKKFNLPQSQTNIGEIGGQAINLIGLIEAPYDGGFEFDIRIESAIYSSGTDLWIGSTLDVDYFVQRPDQIQQTHPFVKAQVIYGSDSVLVSTFNETIALRKGEQLAIYGDRVSTADVVTVFGTRRLQWKIDVELSTTISITLSGEQIVDGVMTSADRVLVKNQGDSKENGIYVTGAGAWSRATDADTSSELVDAAVFVTAGDSHINTAWRQTEEFVSVGVTPNLWTYAMPSDERFRPYPGDEVDNHLIIHADTTFKNSVSKAFLIHDAAAAILKSLGLGEDNPFYSDLLGSMLTNARQYLQDGCAWKYALLKGLQLRGYELSEKPFFSSFEHWWKGINPILCLGLTYELIGGSTTEAIEAQVELLIDWADAGGPFPGVGWDYSSYGYPWINVAAAGGTTGYTAGLCATTAGNTYRFTVLVEIFTGVSTPDLTFTFAILDSGYNEIDTIEFVYNSEGYHTETFDLTAATDGTYFAMRVINDAPVDSRNIFLRYALGGQGEQLLLNSSFDDTSVWTNEDSGTPWSIAGAVLNLSLASGAAQKFTQIISGAGPGNYVCISEYTVFNITFPTDSISLIYEFYDADDNFITSSVPFVSANITSPHNQGFYSAVPVAKIQIGATINSGADIDVIIPFVELWGPVAITNTTVADQQVIRVEEREHFYNPAMSVLISNIENITRKYDNDKIYNKIEIGYGQWQSGDISGIDDTQTKQTRATRFQKIGTTIQLYSDVIAASLAIEQTRRQTIEKSKDYKFDNNTFIIAINPDDVSPDSYLPELDENFTSILNLLNSETRYNTRLSVSRNFLRWRKWFNGCLQHYLNSFYKFVGAEGNFDMISDMVEPSPDCLGESYDAEPLSEKQDIEVTDEIIHTPNHYEMEVPMEWETYKTIRENRKNAIGISLTESDHVPLFIDQLDYEVMNGKAKIMGWTKEYFYIRVIEGGAATQICFPSTSCENPITDEFAEILTDENGVCITV